MFSRSPTAFPDAAPISCQLPACIRTFVPEDTACRGGIGNIAFHASEHTMIEGFVSLGDDVVEHLPPSLSSVTEAEMVWDSPLLPISVILSMQPAIRWYLLYKLFGMFVQFSDVIAHDEVTIACHFRLLSFLALPSISHSLNLEQPVFAAAEHLQFGGSAV